MQRLRSFVVVAALASLSCWLLRAPELFSSALSSAATLATDTQARPASPRAERRQPPRTEITVTLTSPTPGEIIRPGFQTRIEWNVSNEKAVVDQRTLKFSTDGGVTFSQDVKGVGQKKKNFFFWDVPPKLRSNTARLQLTVKFKDGTTAVSTTTGNFVVSPTPQILNVLFTEASGKKAARFEVNGDDFVKGDTILLVNDTPVPGVEFLGNVSKRGTVRRLRLEGATVENILVPGIRVEVKTKIGTTGIESDPLRFRRPSELVQSITPSSTRQGSVVDAVITGSKFTGATSVTFSVPGTSAVILPGTTDTSLPVRITIDPDATIGILDFQIQVPLGIIDSNPVRFTVLPATAPAISRVNPETGTAAGGTPVFIGGEGFVPGDTEVLVGGRPAVSLTVLDSRNLVAIAPAGEPGPASITVLTRTGYAVSEGGFSYFRGEEFAPAIQAIQEAAAEALSSFGGQAVTITGRGFLPGKTRVTFSGRDALEVRVLDANRLIAITPPGEAGPAQVSVQTRNGQASSDAVVSYEYAPPGPPTITGINIAPLRIDDSSQIRALGSIDAPPFGGRLVLRGSGFLPGSTEVTIGGAAAKIETIRDDLLVISLPLGLQNIDDVTVATPSGLAILPRAVRSLGGDLPATTVERILRPVSNPDGSLDVVVLGNGFVVGQTFVAFDTQLKRPVAIQVISSNLMRITIPAGETRPGRLIVWTLAGQSGSEIPEE